LWVFSDHIFIPIVKVQRTVKFVAQDVCQ